MPLAAALLALPAIAWAGPRQDINTIALLAPLALLGAHGVARLRRGAANLLDWFGVMTFSFFAGLIWLGYIAMMTGVPPKIANNFAKTAPGFVPQFEPLPFCAALALTLAWLYSRVRDCALAHARRDALGRGRGAALGLLRHAAAALGRPPEELPQRRAAAQVHAARGRRLHRRARAWRAAARGAQLPCRHPHRAAAGCRRRTPKCRYLIVQGKPREEIAPGAGWRKLADVGRPGDKGERYRLYRYGPG